MSRRKGEKKKNIQENQRGEKKGKFKGKGKRTRSLERPNVTPPAKRQRRDRKKYHDRQMTPGVHHLCGNIDMGTAMRNVKCSFTPKMECLSCKKPHSTKGPCVLVITDRHGEGITNPDIYREVAGEYPHVLVIHADQLTPVEAGNLLEAMKEGTEGLPRL